MACLASIEQSITAGELIERLLKTLSGLFMIFASIVIFFILLSVFLMWYCPEDPFGMYLLFVVIIVGTFLAQNFGRFLG